MKTSNDDSIFAWHSNQRITPNFLATDPYFFSHSSTVMGSQLYDNDGEQLLTSSFETKKKRISLTAPILEIKTPSTLQTFPGLTRYLPHLSGDTPICVAVLSCSIGNARLGLLLHKRERDSGLTYTKELFQPLVLLSSRYCPSFPAAETILLEEMDDGSCTKYRTVVTKYTLKLCFYGHLCGYHLWTPPQIDLEHRQTVNTEISDDCVTITLDFELGTQTAHKLPVNLVFRHRHPNTNPTFELIFSWEYCSYSFQVESKVRHRFGAGGRHTEEVPSSNSMQGTDFMSGRIFPLDKDKIIVVKPRVGPRNPSRIITYAHISVETSEDAQHHPNLTMAEGPRYL